MIIKFDILIDWATVQLKYGIKRKLYPLTKQFTKKKDNIHFINNFIELKGKWDDSLEFGSLLSLKLKNISKDIIKITRLVFPMENGLNKFLKSFKFQDISFLRNGYQSWSTSRSYKLIDKPLRPWLQLVSLVTGNTSNLESNTPGKLGSDMFSIVTDLKNDYSLLVGQCSPFNQFLYIRLVTYQASKYKNNYFEIVYDFGRKMLMPGEIIKLDDIIIGDGNCHELMSEYFTYIRKSIKYKNSKKNITGWSTWYCFYDKISPDLIYKNINIIKKRKLKLDYIQIDDGYQTYVGDWSGLKPEFKGKMKEISDTIRESGYKPGIWLAPFIADKKSNLINTHPGYVLRNEYGNPLVAAYSPNWTGKFCYGIDVTNPGVEEYLRKVIRMVVHNWGFKYLKLDFLYGACLRGGNHQNLKFSRAEVLKYGMKFIREEAGNNVFILGSGMPLSPGIGLVDAMRVGTDTSYKWTNFIDKFFNTDNMIGMKNSIRNSIVRSPMNKCLWLNDPDCLLLSNKEKLTLNRRMLQVNAIIIAGGILFLGDDISGLDEEVFDEINKIFELSKDCFIGDAVPLDIMENGIPELYYNTSGYLGVFNFKKKSSNKMINIKNYPVIQNDIAKLTDIWTNEEIKIKPDQNIILENIPPYSSRLFKIEY